MPENEQIDYVVELPKIDGHRGTIVLGVTRASSGRKATSNLVARLHRKSIGIIMAKLDNDLGGAETYAYSVDKDFVDGKTQEPVNKVEERDGREVFMAETIRDNEHQRAGNRRAKPSPAEYLSRAKRYIDFYEKQKVITH